MSKKTLIVTGAFVAGIAAIHTGFWFYQSNKIKSSIEQMAAEISKEFGRKNAEFFYTSSEVTGYPLNFTVNINQPRFVSAGSGQKLELSTGEEEKLVIKASLLGSRYNISLPEKISIKQSVDDEEQAYILQFNQSSPQISVKFSGNILIGDANLSTIEYLNKELKKLSYSDNGYTITSPEGGEKLAWAEASSLQVERQKGEGNNISSLVTAKIHNMDNSGLLKNTKAETSSAEPDAEQNSKLGMWPVNADLDFTVNNTRDEAGKEKAISIELRKGEINAAAFGLDLKGNIQASGEDIFPYGDLSIKISNYGSMVDYLGGVANEAFEKSSVPLFHIKSEKSIDFKKVLYEVASEKYNNDQDILLTISRQQGKSLFIGQKGLMEVVDLIKSSSASTPEETKENVNNVMPLPTPAKPATAAEPAAGNLKNNEDLE